MSVKYRRKFSQSPLKLSRGGFKISSSIRAGFLEGFSFLTTEVRWNFRASAQGKRPVGES